MRLCSVATERDEVAAIDVAGRGVVPLSAVDAGAPANLLDVIGVLSAPRVHTWAQRLAQLSDDAFTDPATVRWAPPYRHPPKLWGIGLNYVDHADDLAAAHPTAPASFMKGDHTIIGPGEPIVLPVQSRRVTAEGELGIVIGRECRNVEEADALEYVAGVCCVLDQTAEDILQENPRFLTRAKNFPTFLAFGPHLVTMDEVLERFDSLADIVVGTYCNGVLQRQNCVANMLYSPQMLISFHSKVMPLLPGDVISTGTPGAVVIAAGDVAECRIPGIGSLVNPVVTTSGIN
ncbi:MAG: fumarylacetoacetate hydrolase family protein [Euzebyales bacterium]|nr:fumarylacetoacetate hydrolase family protein [Euzebyales bacterium]MDQ3342072.1 fumarylacetoacetate hydrolase family protein [Actinomycetota bacterium]